MSEKVAARAWQPSDPAMLRRDFGEHRDMAAAKAFFQSAKQSPM
jgi:hypothetical protein